MGHSVLELARAGRDLGLAAVGNFLSTHSARVQVCWQVGVIVWSLSTLELCHSNCWFLWGHLITWRVVLFQESPRSGSSLTICIFSCLKNQQAQTCHENFALSLLLRFIYLFKFGYVKGWRQEKEILLLLGHYSNDCKYPSWDRLTLGARHSIWISPVCGWDSDTWVVIFCLLSVLAGSW